MYSGADGSRLSEQSQLHETLYISVHVLVLGAIWQLLLAVQCSAVYSKLTSEFVSVCVF